LKRVMALANFMGPYHKDEIHLVPDAWAESMARHGLVEILEDDDQTEPRVFAGAPVRKGVTVGRA